MRYEEKQCFNFTLSNGEEIRFFCWCACGGRVGFQHRCDVFVKNQFLNKFFKVQYYNRTWESFRYESLLYHTINILNKTKLINKEELEEIKEKIKYLEKNYQLTYKLVVEL